MHVSASLILCQHGRAVQLFFRGPVYLVALKGRWGRDSSIYLKAGRVRVLCENCYRDPFAHSPFSTSKCKMGEAWKAWLQASQNS